jgi:hypothetical protein
MNDSEALARLLTRREHAAAMELVQRVRRGVPADLWRALLFGSRARGEGRPDSDLDVLLVFHALPRDREPQAGIAEWIAEEVAEETGVPVTVWSVSRTDLERGRRTPMLVDSLDDGVPLWPPGAPPLRVGFTPADALFCTGQLLDRVEEGSAEVEEAFAAGAYGAAARRARDDLVRLCTAALLLEGVTRPRTAGCVRCFAGRHGPPRQIVPVLRWAADSYGADGKDRGDAIPPPPGGLGAAARAVDVLRRRVVALRRGLADAPGDAG